MCGGDLDIEKTSSIATCQYCGSTQTLPKLENNKKAKLYERANQMRRQNEFDKASVLYESILNEDTTDAEAYWSLVLCKYGVEYVEDPESGKRIPTCNRTLYASILTDGDYMLSLTHADDSQRALYEEEAEIIDGIQKRILEISNTEEPFDIFICYKETDEEGNRTQDSVLAQDMYQQLSNEGFKVFFARITLEDKLGSAYEPYIFAALQSSKVMVVIGTKSDYFNAVWVKNEWSRFLGLIKNGEKKVLIPTYRDMNAYDLPKDFSHLQAQDMGKLGFMQDLIRGIKKIVTKDQETAPIPPISNQGSQIYSEKSLIKRISMFISDNDTKSAEEYCDKLLDLNPDCISAYYYKVFLGYLSNVSIDKFAARLEAASPEPGTEEKEFITSNTYHCMVAYIIAGLSSRIRFIATNYPNILQEYFNRGDNIETSILSYSIMFAAKKPQSAITLLECGADVHSTRIYKGKSKHTKYAVLSEAIWNAKSVEIVQALLEKGADPNFLQEAYYDDGTAGIVPMLSYAIYAANNPVIVKLLLDHGADPNCTRMYFKNGTQSNIPAISDAIWNAKNYKIVELLLEHGAVANSSREILTSKDKAVQSLLTEAIVDAKSIDMVDLLLKHGATWNNKIRYNNISKKEVKYPFNKNCNLSKQFLKQLKTRGWKKPTKFDIIKRIVIGALLTTIVLGVVCLIKLPSIYTYTLPLSRDYKTAENLLIEGKHQEAMEKFNTLGGYKFGPYRWKILEVKEKTALLITYEVVEQVYPHNKEEDYVWETSSLRNYLNSEFYSKFSSEEKERILTVKLPNSKVLSLGGNITEDKIFLLTKEELFKYFDPLPDEDDEEYIELSNKFVGLSYLTLRKFLNETNYSTGVYDLELSPWMLRDSEKRGKSNSGFFYVPQEGYEKNRPLYSSHDKNGLRPAMYITLE